jgi:hypothetical protein
MRKKSGLIPTAELQTAQSPIYYLLAFIHFFNS